MTVKIPVRCRMGSCLMLILHQKNMKMMFLMQDFHNFVIKYSDNNLKSREQ